MNPYLVLGVTLKADDRTIRQAYLDAVRVASPEADPVRFKEVVAAYEKIKDATSRYRHELFNTESSGESPLDAFVQYARLTARAAPLSKASMKDFLRSCANP